MNKRFKAAYLTVLTVGILVATPAGLSASNFVSQPFTYSLSCSYAKISKLFLWIGGKYDSGKTKVSESVSSIKEKCNSAKTKASESIRPVSEYMMAIPAIYFLGKGLQACLPNMITNPQAMGLMFALGLAGRFIPDIINYFKKDDQGQ